MTYYEIPCLDLLEELLYIVEEKQQCGFTSLISEISTNGKLRDEDIEKIILTIEDDPHWDFIQNLIIWTKDSIWVKTSGELSYYFTVIERHPPEKTTTNEIITEFLINKIQEPPE